MLHHRLWSLALASLFLVLAGMSASAQAQCLLANPSFEIAGDAPAVFGGWNQFGDVGSIAAAAHGKVAARVSGPQAAGWGVSAFWQKLHAEPGQQFTVTACVSHPATRPLTGDSRAIINIEWRNAAGNLIDYESHVVADANTPTDQTAVVVRTSEPAPPGTASTHVLLGVLHSPEDPSPDVYYDQVTFEQATTAQPEAPQWLDFPGGRTLQFSGYGWRVKGPIVVGGIPYSDGDEFVWVDSQERLHLSLLHRAGSWNNTEVALEQPLGYGDYTFTTVGDLGSLDPQSVLGLFLWQYTPCYPLDQSWWNPNNEIDIEFSRWGEPLSPIGQFVVQPYFESGNMLKVGMSMQAEERTSHAFRWLSDRIEFRSWRGGPYDESPETMIALWVYEGEQVPRPEQPRVHINFRKLSGEPQTDQEVILESFRFVPECSGPSCPDVPADALAVVGPAQLFEAYPNPFNPQTTLRYELSEPTSISLQVHDVGGRRVRTLMRGFAEAGLHETTWNGANDAGMRLPTGVYFVRLQSHRFVTTRRLVLMK